ncbi:MAG: hypothetical protein F6J87_27170 [Spirulina sp. SIO3F2]|nr:hypothetical protein [Spirulina sp. SIO3F2]
MSAAIGWNDLDGASTALTIGDRTLAGPDQQVEQGSGLFDWLTQHFPQLTGVVQWVRDIGARFKGWLSEKAKQQQSAWTQTQITGLMHSARAFVFNFNWNASDEELERLLESQLQALSSQFGGAIGCSLGWGYGPLEGLVLNAGVGKLMELLHIPVLRFDWGLARQALKATREEALDELAALWGGVFRSAVLFAGRWVMIKSFKQVRRGIKFLARHTGLDERLGLSEVIQQWGEPGSEPWIINDRIDDWIASIPNPILRSFLDNAREEFVECQTEASYVYASSLDTLRQEQLDTREAVLGTQHTVEVTPDREAPDERIVLSGRDQVLRGAITTTIATHQQIHNRDVGQIVGEPLHEAMLNKAPHSTLSLKLQWCPRRERPFTKTQYELDGGNSDHWTTPEFDLPWIIPSGLDWDKIKFAMGGSDGFISGPMRCAAYIGWPEQGLAGRQVVLYASTKTEGKRMLQRLANLSDGKVYGFKYGERERDPDNRALTYKYNVRVYPKSATVTSQRREIDKAKGRGTLTGNWSPRREVLDMWVDKADVDVNEILQDLRRWHTPLPF